jgi:hypothetical protein
MFPWNYGFHFGIASYIFLGAFYTVLVVVAATILNALPKDALKWWAARTVATFAYDRAETWLGMTRDEAIDWLRREPLRYTGARADFGSAVHATAEALALGRPAPRFTNLEERQAAAAFLHWVRDFDVTFDATEATVYSRRQRYAGTTDVIVRIAVERLAEVWPAHPWDAEDGATHVRLLGDYKTGGDVAERKGIYPDVALQLNAYAHADFVGLPGGAEEPIGHLDGLFALHLGPAGYRMVPVRLGVDVFKAFLYVREVFRFQEVISQEVLGNAFERFLLAVEVPRPELEEDDAEVDA